MESSGEPLGLMFCLDCMYKHSRDLEHHLEDAVRVTKGLERNQYEDLIDRVREIRKEIDQKRIFKKLMQEAGAKEVMETGKKIIEKERKLKTQSVESCPTCSMSSNPAKREEEIIEIEGKKYRQVIEPIKSKKEFAPESFRTMCPKCSDGRCEKCPPEIKDTTTRIIIGCPVGEWNPETERCNVSTETHLIYHELEPVG